MSKYIEPLSATLNGISQVNFLQNPVFGLMIVVGLLFVDVYTVISVLLASLISYLIARVLYDDDFAMTGLASFNSVLLVLMVEAFLGGFSSILYVIPATMIVMAIQHLSKVLLEKVNLAYFSIPTILATYLMLFIHQIWPGVFFSDQLSFKLTGAFDGLDFSFGNHFFISASELYLQGTLLFSLVLILAFIIFEKDYLLYLVCAYFFSIAIFYVLGFAFPLDVMGFTTFNIVLTMMALKAFGFLPMNKEIILKLFLVTLAVIITKFILDYLLGLIGLPSIVLPFIVVTESVLISRNLKQARQVEV